MSILFHIHIEFLGSRNSRGCPWVVGQLDMCTMALVLVLFLFPWQDTLTKSNGWDKVVYFSIQLQVAVHCCEDIKAGTSVSHTTSSQGQEEVNADMLIQLLIVFNQILYTQFSIPSLGNDTAHSGTDLSELIMENKKILYGQTYCSVWWRPSFIEELFQGDYRLCQIDIKAPLTALLPWVFLKSYLFLPDLHAMTLILLRGTAVVALSWQIITCQWFWFLEILYFYTSAFTHESKTIK